MSFLRFLLSLLLFGLMMHSNATEPVKTANSSLKDLIVRSISYPDGLAGVSDYEIVLVEFRLEPCGFISVLNTNSSHPGLEKYVVEKIQSIRIQSHDYKESLSAIKLVFRRSK